MRFNRAPFQWISKFSSNKNKRRDMYLNPKQKEFMTATERYVAYGGARGGGKSFAVRVKAMLLAMKNAGIRILIIRRTYGELKENHIRELSAMCGKVATYNDTAKSLYFKNGSMIKFGYCDSESDVSRYQGMEFDVLFIDEATQLTKFQFDTLNASVRGVNDFPKRTYLTCNPGGVGHSWVKRLFVDREFETSERAEDYRFIKATVFDNKALLEKDCEYLETLKKLPEALRRAWLEGDWNVTSGSYFPEISESYHIIAPRDIPPIEKVYAAIDYGLDCFCCLFIGFCGEDIYVLDEIWEKNLIISSASNRLLSFDYNISEVIAPPDLWGRSQETGKSRADIFAENGVMLTKCSNDRKSGLFALKELLKKREGKPKMQISSRCKMLFKSLSEIQSDSRFPDLTANEPHELTHAVDALRYFASFWYYPKNDGSFFDISVLREDVREDYLSGSLEIKRMIEKKYGRRL